MSGAMLLMLAALGIELLLLSLVFLSVSWFRSRAMRRRDLRAMRTLIARVRQEAPEREKAIGRYLEHGMGFSGEALDQARASLLSAERVLLQRFATVYGQRAAVAAARFDGDLFAALESYHAVGAGGAVAPATQGNADGVQLDALQQENRRLSEELQVSMETMSRMLKEYSTMFAAGPVERAGWAQDAETLEGVGTSSQGRTPATRSSDESAGHGAADDSVPYAADRPQIQGRGQETGEAGALPVVRPAGGLAESVVANTALHEGVQSAPWEDDRDVGDADVGTFDEGDVEVMGHDEADVVADQGERDLFDSSDPTAGSGDREASGAAGAGIGEMSEDGELDDEEVLSIRSGA
jgi:hypothetical protein